MNVCHLWKPRETFDCNKIGAEFGVPGATFGETKGRLCRKPRQVGHSEPVVAQRQPFPHK
jgi:hypothetical protein